MAASPDHNPPADDETQPNPSGTRMSSGDGQTGDLPTRIAAARERNRHTSVARGMVSAGVAPDADAVQFVSEAEVRAIMSRAHESGLQAGWRRRAGWDEVMPELRDWLATQGRVVSGLTGVTASGSWFAEQAEKLWRLWGDLYLYAPDGLSGYLVNQNSELGLETISWPEP